MGLLEGKPCPQGIPGGVHVGVGVMAARQAAEYCLARAVARMPEDYQDTHGRTWLAEWVYGRAARRWGGRYPIISLCTCIGRLWAACGHGLADGCGDPGRGSGRLADDWPRLARLLGRRTRQVASAGSAWRYARVEESELGDGSER
ncbi:MAG: hypothetical protein JWM19_2152 [Actinomycetia bacterium]|nr:hypothetical protein [Actinomycetes bacterium]